MAPPNGPKWDRRPPWLLGGPGPRPVPELADEGVPGDHGGDEVTSGEVLRLGERDGGRLRDESGVDADGPHDVVDLEGTHERSIRECRVDGTRTHRRPDHRAFAAVRAERLRHAQRLRALLLVRMSPKRERDLVADVLDRLLDDGARQVLEAQ
jgi:hypothetical protein